jgi:hypothetical protein
VFQHDPTAGIVGGVVYIHKSDGWAYDQYKRSTVHGAIKAYRRTCFDDIGGLAKAMGWDGIDEYGARARGWRVHVLPELPVLHFKARGSAQPSLSARWEEGRGTYYLGYRPSWVVLRAGYRALIEPPRLIGGVALASAVVWCSITRQPRADPVARAQLRHEQRLRFLRQKASFGAPRSELVDGGPAFWLTGRK